MEIQRTPAASTYVVFPMLSPSGQPQTGLTVVGHWLAWADTARPASQSLRPLSGATVEIDTSALYQCPIASTELPVASPYVLCRFSTAGIATQYLLIRTATLFANVQAVTAGAMTAAGFAANAINAAKLDPDVTTELQSGLATAAALATVDTNVDSILVDTAEIGAAGAGLTAVAIGVGGIASTSFAAGAIDAAAIAANAIGASELAADGASEYADAFLGRNLHRGASGGRTVGQSLMALRNKVSISAGTLTVTGEDDTTAEWTATVATEAVTALVTSIDPA